MVMDSAAGILFLQRITTMRPREMLALVMAS